MRNGGITMAFPRELLDQHPANGEALPVFAKLIRGWVYLGHAYNHQDAATCGIIRGVSCEKISVAKPDDDERKFYALH